MDRKIAVERLPGAPAENGCTPDPTGPALPPRLTRCPQRKRTAVCSRSQSSRSFRLFQSRDGANRNGSDGVRTGPGGSRISCSGPGVPGISSLAGDRIIARLRKRTGGLPGITSGRARTGLFRRRTSEVLESRPPSGVHCLAKLRKRTKAGCVSRETGCSGRGAAPSHNNTGSRIGSSADGSPFSQRPADRPGYRGVD